MEQGSDAFTHVKAESGIQTLPKSFCFEIPQENMITIKMSNQKRESSVLVPKICCNSVAQTRWFKRTEMYSLIVLKAGSPISRGLCVLPLKPWAESFLATS